MVKRSFISSQSSNLPLEKNTKRNKLRKEIPSETRISLNMNRKYRKKKEIVFQGFKKQNNEK